MRNKELFCCFQEVLISTDYANQDKITIMCNQSMTGKECSYTKEKKAKAKCNDYKPTEE